MPILRATSGVRIVAVDTDEQRLGRATELGADFTLMSDERAADEIMRITGGVGADAVFDFVGVTPTLTTALACIGNRGEITAVGLGAGEIAFRPEPVGTYVPWGTTIRKPYGGTRRDLQEVVNLAQRGMIDVHVDRFDLTDAAQALERLEQGEVSGRAVLVP